MPRFGGRKPLTEAGPAIHVTGRFSRELVDALREMAADTGRTVADIVRAGAENEVKKWRRKTGRPPR